MILLSDELIREIIEDSNHTDIDEVRAFIESGDIEIYQNEIEFIADNNKLEVTNLYTRLSNGYFAYYLG